MQNIIKSQLPLSMSLNGGHLVNNRNPIWAVLNRCVSETFGSVFSIKSLTYLLTRSIKSMIISHTIKFESRKWRIHVKKRVFRTVSGFLVSSQ